MIGLLPKWLSRVLLPVMFVFTLLSHSLTLLIPDYHSLLSNALSKLIPGVRPPYTELVDLKRQNTSLKQKNKALHKQLSNQASKNKASKAVSQKIAKRLIRNVTVNTGSVLVESFPYLGVGTLIGVTAMDVNDACETMKDINNMLANIGQEPDKHSASEICSYTDKIPSPQRIADYWEHSTSALKDAAERKQNQIKEHVGNFKHDLGGFMGYLVERSKARWQKVMGFIKYLMFEHSWI